ncbi:transporter [Methanosarcina sp. 1.H.T.1A.1]|uniref:MarC family protein n=1 Tax=Methanosarcina sp. 1.H.T.1A.1 TaxID=1483602 RepID=UPI00062286C4|nr:MarC family protein [Methanosarcina sp. 1.H.T.1A.1]KKI00011.1 transporter [Methanosarcina sp. 1.H.T.1A.1]
MDLESLDFYAIFDLFILLLIGMGPKIALVPFLDLTAGMEEETRKKVAGQMVKTAVGVALILVLLGSLLMKLLHFTPGAVSIAGGIILMLLALHMLIGSGKSEEHDEKTASRDPMQMALYPLAVPYLLNPAGIAVLVTVYDQLDSLLMLAIVVGLVLLMGALDLAVFKNLDKLAKHLDPSRLMVTEAVFGVLLAALAVQLVLDGLAKLGIISGLPGH